MPEHPPANPHDHGTPANWETVAEKIVADCRVFRVNRKTCRHPHRATTNDFFVLESSDWVNVVAVTAAGAIVLVRQFRFGTEGLSLEVPGGVMEPGEDPVEGARRELEEETGFIGGTARMLGRVHPNPAIQGNSCHLIVIEGVERASQIAWDEHEEIEVVVVPAADVFAAVHAGEVTHALALNALLLYELEWRRAHPQV